ncbi:MAG: hypothetical protein F6K19_48315 [Cyanothece sp. SIO1E1]|nr:hypothetical protein [Cyanothece sp. SIO1E1]
MEEWFHVRWGQDLAAFGKMGEMGAVMTYMAGGARYQRTYSRPIVPQTDFTVANVLLNPQSLYGLSPSQFTMRLTHFPAGWRVEALGAGQHKGQGWVLREYAPNGEATGRMIRWHPGGGHHGVSPYWVVNPGTGSIRVGSQFIE